MKIFIMNFYINPVWYNNIMQDLLFYNEYEQFYTMATESKAFRTFCEKAFGRDFSQDGFSDVSQVDRVLKYIPTEGHVLDIGCGNGKMLGYLQEKTGACIYGFDYSGNAISLAKEVFSNKSNFIQGCIGEVDYPEESFDVVISMDTMYFAPDMSALVDQIMKWLKCGGVFFTCYQEGDVMPKTENAYTTVLARALTDKSIPFEYIDITRESYDLLKNKRQAALECRSLFEEEGNESWFEMLVEQTDYADKPYEEYRLEMARYVYTVTKRCLEGD